MLNVHKNLFKAMLAIELLLNSVAFARVLNVRDFGARGDGVSDDYFAMQAAASAICAHPGSTLIYPKGIYRIGQFKIIKGPNRNQIRNIRYVGCKGVSIVGKDAKIDVKGDFHRGADNVGPRWSISYTESVIPFEMIDSDNFRIQGFEIDGNADVMTRDPKVVEAGVAGILTTRCKDYVIEDIYVHHFATDGITLGGNSHVADRNATVKNVRATNNARQGMSVIQVRGGLFVSSVFRDTGRTGGTYGGNDPMAGVDVEPVRAPPDEDVMTGLLIFERCRFEENLGPQFISVWPQKVQSIVVRDSYIRATSPDSSRAAFISVPSEGMVEGNTFELSARHGISLAPLETAKFKSLVRLTYKGNTFNLDSRDGIYTAQHRAPVSFVSNIVRVASRKPESDMLRLRYLDEVTDNLFFMGAAGYGGAGMEEVAVGYANVGVVQNNRYDTDLTGPRSYSTLYYGTDLKVSNERFVSGNFKPVKRTH